jgi:hypothetical protein
MKHGGQSADSHPLAPDPGGQSGEALIENARPFATCFGLRGPDALGMKRQWEV